MPQPPPPPSFPAHSALVIFSHGSRDARWREPIEAVARQIRQHSPGTPVACAYLELCAPTLAEAAGDLVAASAGSLRVLRIFPLFLGQGRHAREDLPVLVAQLRAAHPEVAVELMPSAGEFPALIALIAQLALAWQPPSAPTASSQAAACEISAKP
jgi:sirohydrochlorin cobaltochelatase